MPATEYEQTESKEALELIKEAGFDGFRQAIKENPNGVRQTIRILANHPDMFNTHSPNFVALKEARQILYGIDKTSRTNQREIDIAALRVSPEQLVERERLSALPAHLNRLHKDHTTNISSWQATFNPIADSDEL